MTPIDALEKVVRFLRPTGAPRTRGQAHVPLLALMPRQSPVERVVGSGVAGP